MRRLDITGRPYAAPVKEIHRLLYASAIQRAVLIYVIAFNDLRDPLTIGWGLPMKAKLFSSSPWFSIWTADRG
jgi:hypothetical protein